MAIISLPNSEQMAKVLTKQKILSTDFTAPVAIAVDAKHAILGNNTANSLGSFVDVSDYSALRVAVFIGVNTSLKVIIESHSGLSAYRSTKEYTAIDVVNHSIEIEPETKYVRINIQNISGASVNIQNAVVTGLKERKNENNKPQTQLSRNLTVTTDVQISEKLYSLGKSTDSTIASFADVSDYTALKVAVFLGAVGKFKVVLQSHSGRGTGMTTREYKAEGTKLTIELTPDTKYARIYIENTGTGVISVQNVIITGLKGVPASSIIDKATGERVNLTAVTDTDGNAALRVVEAAPVAYDVAGDTLKISGAININHDSTLIAEYNKDATAVNLDSTTPSKVYVFDLFNANAKELMLAIRFFSTHANNVVLKLEYENDDTFTRSIEYFNGDTTAFGDTFKLVNATSTTNVFASLKPFGRYVRLTITLKSGSTSASYQSIQHTYVKG